MGPEHESYLDGSGNIMVWTGDGYMAVPIQLGASIRYIDHDWPGIAESSTSSAYDAVDCSSYIKDWDISVECEADHAADSFSYMMKIIEEKEKKMANIKYVHIDHVIFDGPATIVFWSDGTKTVVKCMDGDEFAYDVGIAMATLKKMLGDNYGGYKHDVRKAIDAELERQMRLEEKRKKTTKEDVLGLYKITNAIMSAFGITEDEAKTAIKKSVQGEAPNDC